MCYNVSCREEQTLHTPLPTRKDKHMKAQSQKVVNILSRTVIVRTGVILYEILSSDGETKYFATYKAGGEVFCECKGFEFRGKCRHAEYIREAEATYRYDILSQAEDIVAEAEQAAINASLDAAYDARAQ